MEKEFELEGQSLIHPNVTKKETYGVNIFRWTFIFCLVLTNVVTYLLTAHIDRIRHQDQYSQDVTEYNGPLYDTVDRSYRARRFSSFAHRSKYTANASQEVDAAWTALGADFGPFTVPKSMAHDLDLTADHVPFPPEGGVEQIAVENEALHQIHCLNVLRRALWFNYEHYRAEGKDSFSQPEYLLRLHAGHCVDNLRQRIMCTADLGVVPFLWLGRKGDVIPDFAREHRCRNFESLLSWAERHQTAIPDDLTLLPSPEASVIPIAS